MNAFDWKAQPSMLSEVLKGQPAKAEAGRHSGSRFRQYDIGTKARQAQREKTNGVQREAYRKKCQALASIVEWTAARREAEIRRCVREIPRHLALAQTHDKEGWRAHHAEMARKLTDKAETLKALRPTQGGR